MPPKSTFIPRAIVPDRFSNITLNRTKVGLKIVSSNILSVSTQKTFTNCAQNYKAYDKEVLGKKQIYFPNFG